MSIEWRTINRYIISCDALSVKKLLNQHLRSLLLLIIIGNNAPDFSTKINTVKTLIMKSKDQN